MPSSGAGAISGQQLSDIGVNPTVVSSKPIGLYFPVTDGETVTVKFYNGGVENGQPTGTYVTTSTWQNAGTGNGGCFFDKSNMSMLKGGAMYTYVVERSLSTGGTIVNSFVTPSDYLD